MSMCVSFLCSNCKLVYQFYSVELEIKNPYTVIRISNLQTGHVTCCVATHRVIHAA